MATSIVPRAPGIYKITCLANNKIYIGSSINLHKRWGQHRRELRGNYHVNKYLQRAWIEHGESAFEFEILELCTDEDLLGREQYYLDTFRPFGSRGFNISVDAASGSKGRETSLETRQKLSVANKGKVLSPEHRRKISSALKGQPKTTEAIAKTNAANKGRIVSTETRAKIGAATKGRKHSVDLIEKRIDPLRKEYHFIDPEGNEVSVKGLYKFCRENGLCGQHMASVAAGKRKHHKGWKVKQIK